MVSFRSALAQLEWLQCFVETATMSARESLGRVKLGRASVVGKLCDSPLAQFGTRARAGLISLVTVD
jgi:hypothetical protein